jgi:hypothetical protein
VLPAQAAEWSSLFVITTEVICLPASPAMSNRQKER